MYSRSERFPAKCEGGTLIAPNTYIIKDKPARGLWIPFNATANRWQKSALPQGPSPLTYFPKFRKHRIPGGSSLKYTEKRVCKVPPRSGVFPSSYKDIFRTKSLKRPAPQKPVHARLCKKPSSCQDFTPVVKNVLNQYALKKELPAYLIFPGEVSVASRKYGGPKWSARTAERKSGFDVQNTPGPGRYDVGVSSKDLEELNNYKKARKYLFDEIRNSRKPLPPCTEEEKNTPVRFYDVSCPYLFKKITFNVKGNVWSTVERFPEKKAEVHPGPADYNPKLLAKCQASTKRTPFLAWGPRFQRESNYLPLGPGSYKTDQDTIAEKVKKKTQTYWGYCRTPFGSSVPRFRARATSDLGPGHYDVKFKPERREMFGVTKHEGIARTMPRFTQKKEDFPDRMYDIENGWKLISSKQSHNKSDTPLFGRAVRKGMPLNEGELAHNSGFHAPRPVNPERPLTMPTAVPMRTRRFSKSGGEPKKIDLPFYEIHPKYGSSVFKESFNKLFAPPKMEISRDTEKPRRDVLKCFLPQAIVNFSVQI